MPSDGSRPTSIPTALSVTPRAGPRKKAGLRQNFKPTDLSRCCATWHASRWMTCVYRNLLSIDQVENRPTSARNDLAALLLPDPVGLGRSPLSGATAELTTHHRPFFKSLYFQVLTAIVLGVLLGHFYPELGEQMKPLGDAFIKTIKMIIAPIIFCTVVHGIASMQDMKRVGRVGLKALVYFEVLTSLALIVGLIVANTLQPGAAMNVDASTIDTRAIQGFVAKSKEQSTIQFLMDIIPNTVVGAFAQGEILQVLFFAVLFAFGLQMIGERGQIVLGVIDQASHALFAVVGIIMKAAPIGAFGAMAFTIGKYGVVTLVALAHLMAALFLAQATNTDLSFAQQLGIIGVLLLTSKGAAGVTGSGFIVLAATLSSVGHIPVASIALILGVDRFMSEARALTNLIGNGVATVVVSRWEGALDMKKMQSHLNQETEAEADTPEQVLVEDEIKAAGPPKPVTF